MACEKREALVATAKREGGYGTRGHAGEFPNPIFYCGRN